MKELPELSDGWLLAGMTGAFRLVGAENAVASCDLHVLVHETAKPVASEGAGWSRGRAGECCRREG